MTDENLHDSTDQLVEDLFAEQAVEGRANDDSFADEQDTYKGDQVNDKPISQLAEVNKQKQVEVWSNRILSGEADLSDLPKDKAWLKPLISRKIEQQETNLNVEALLEKKLAERDAKARKEQEIKEFSVFKSQIAELDSEEKEIVKKHRKTNIYYYLSTISDARQDLRKLKQFTKKHASFLFGLNLDSLENNSSLVTKVQDRVSRILDASANKTLREKTLQDIFLDQIEKQRTIYKENEQLTPKISIKFYSVKEKNVKAKAFVVSDTIVDALEKRKAFRKVIKDAKEELMRTSGVKGVKIQVSGRLNGAEIARSEWVRAGRVPLQTLRANIDYSYRTASTIYGIIGVKVWIFKGYV
jgi:ribosomal protein S3